MAVLHKVVNSGGWIRTSDLRVMSGRSPLLLASSPTTSYALSPLPTGAYVNLHAEHARSLQYEFRCISLHSTSPPQVAQLGRSAGPRLKWRELAHKTAECRDRQQAETPWSSIAPATRDVTCSVETMSFCGQKRRHNVLRRYDHDRRRDGIAVGLSARYTEV